MNDEPVPLPIGNHEINDAVDEAFDQGNRTIPAVRGRMFSFEPQKRDVANFSNDPIMRLEQKIDAVISTIASLKAKVDSIDSVLARIINRS